MILAQLTNLARPGNRKEGYLADEMAARIDIFCAALSTASSSGLPAEAGSAIATGLQALQQIAAQAEKGALPQQPGAWQVTLEQTPLAGALLNLKRKEPAPIELDLQVGRDGNFHGIISLALGSEPDTQALAFDLTQDPGGWMLRCWDDDWQSQLRLAISPGAALPWVSGGVYDALRQVLPTPVSLATGWLSQAVPPANAPEAPVSRPADDQTMLSASEAEGLNLFCLVNQQNGQVLPLNGRLSIGRGKDNNLCLEDQELSRTHAVIEPAGGGWQIQDLHSTNGTLLNDKRLAEPAMLKQGDMLKIGKTRFQFTRWPPAAR